MTDRRESSQRPTWRSRNGDGGQLDDATTYIERLKERPVEEAVPKLIEVMRAESWFLRDRAGKALVGYGDEAVGAIELLIKDGLWYTRAAAIRALGRIGSPRSLVKVFAYLTDNNRTVVDETAKALLDYCNHDRSLAIAKVLHGRGLLFRDEIIATLLRLDRDGGERLRRLISEKSLMGPEGSLKPEEEERLLLTVSDKTWHIRWEILSASEPLHEPESNLIQFLRGNEEL